MTIEEIILEKAKRLTSVPDALLSSIDRLQKSIFETIIQMVGELEKDGDLIKVSKKNLALVDRITDELKKVIVGKDYVLAVKTFAGQFDKQAVLSDDFFKKEFPEFTNSSTADAILANSKRHAVETLIDTTPKTKFIQPLRNLLDTQVSAGASWAETVKAIRTYTVGDPKVEGKLYQYSKQIAHDLFATADRAYTNQVAQDIGAEFFQYFGDVILDSRDFCITRHGKFYHKKEVEAWGELGDWQGKMPGTNPSTIFVNAGGFNCRHGIVPRSMKSVPMDVLKKNLANGNWKPSDKLKKLLGI